MKQISWWASKNPWKARAIIGLLYILIPGVGLISGIGLLAVKMEISALLLAVAVLCFISGAAFYPGKKEKEKYSSADHFYKRQKSCDWLLAFSTFLLMAFVGNNPESTLMPAKLQGASLPVASLPVPVEKRAVEHKKQSLKETFSRSQRKAIRKELRKLLRETFAKKKEGKSNTGTRVALVVISIIVGVILSSLLAALACNLSCTGSETLAVFVLLFGAAAIALLLVVTIRGIFKRYPKVPRYESKSGRPSV